MGGGVLGEGRRKILGGLMELAFGSIYEIYGINS